MAAAAGETPPRESSAAAAAARHGRRPATSSCPAAVTMSDSGGGRGQLAVGRSSASCTEELITFEAEHRDSDQQQHTDTNGGGSGGGNDLHRGGSESSRSRDKKDKSKKRRFMRLRRNQSQRTDEERQKRLSYTREKKDASRRVEEYIRNQNFTKLCGWLKFRCAVFHKIWVKFYCVLKPGFLVVYKDEHMQRRVGWVGTILLSSVYVIQRPTQREGFCFKLIHCLNKSLWVNKGPKKLQPVGNLKGLNLPLTSLIIRAPDEQNGKKWLDAMKGMCSSFFYDVWSKQDKQQEKVLEIYDVQSRSDSDDSDDELEPEDGRGREDGCMSDNSLMLVDLDASACSEEIHEETLYVEEQEEPLAHLNPHLKSEGNQIGSGKVEILLGLARQIKPNQPLSRITIPPFVNHPRSFLDKLQDMFYRVDLIAEMNERESPRERMELFAKFMLWLQNFHPTRDMKKFYNSVLGEKSRCYFKHPDGSRTHFLAEEVTHHPPASAIYCVNKKQGFHIRGLMEFEIRFHGYYVRTNVSGGLEVHLDKWDEVYKCSFPDLVVVNVFLGQFRIDFEGPCTLSCPQTGYTCEIENKTRWTPWGRENQFHRIRAKLLDPDHTPVMTAEGHWNSAVYLKNDKQSAGGSKVFWRADRSELLQKFVVHQNDLDESESSRLWCGLTEALLRGDEEDAKIQKLIIEERQRDLRQMRETMGVEYKPATMTLDPETGLYDYVHHSAEPWNPDTDLYQYEHQFHIKVHRAGLNNNLSHASASVSGGGGDKKRVSVKRAGGGGGPALPVGDSDYDSEGIPRMPPPHPKQPSKERINMYNNRAECINEEMYEMNMQEQMKNIQRDLKTLHLELKTIHSANQAAAAAGSPSQLHRSPKHAPPANAGGLNWTSILFCLLCVAFCVLWVYLRPAAVATSS